MALKDRKIKGSTPVHEFPDKYNALIDELIGQINSLNNQIAIIRREYEDAIQAKESEINALRAEYVRMFDERMESFEDRFDEKMDEFEHKFKKIRD